MTIVIVGMLDEREEALSLIGDRIRERGLEPCLIDISVGSGAIVPTLTPDVTVGELADLAERSTGLAVARGDAATAVVTEGLRAKVRDMQACGEVQGIIAITGMTGALIALPAMMELPFGIPKILISGATTQPAHAATFGEYFSRSDITVMHSVVDTVGMNPLVRTLALNGADAVSGMVEGRLSAPPEKERPSVAVTEFGYVDKGAYHIREILQKDFEIVSIHAMGMGDRAALDLTPQGVFTAFVDLMPGSFSEHVLGGNRDAGPDRLDVAADLNIPYIFCPGGFDMISCGPPERNDTDDPLWTSRRIAERKLLVAPPRVQARTNPEEMQETARAVADRLNRYRNKARVKAVIPLRGLSSLSVEGGPLNDPAADAAFASTLKSHLDPEIEVIEVDADINDPVFAQAVADALAGALTKVGVYEEAEA
ncbi:MAG: Tm-1-like ATP-binding domain-containing protein [Thermoleophilia bacterium]|nr:Tm-1-like ATP-binding domain-containing protein [Thermoleophilia bacterium]